MELYHVGDAVYIIPFDELFDTLNRDRDKAALDESSCYGIARYYIDKFANTGVYYVNQVNDMGSEADYRLEDGLGELLPYFWLHCMLRPAQDDDPIEPGPVDELFDFLLHTEV